MNIDKVCNFDEEAEILKALGHPIRLKIVVGLLSRECNVKQIWECLGLPQATVSQHLGLLKNRKIVESKREGIEVYYTVIHPMAKKIVEMITGMEIGENFDPLPQFIATPQHSEGIFSRTA